MPTIELCRCLHDVIMSSLSRAGLERDNHWRFSAWCHDLHVVALTVTVYHPTLTVYRAALLSLGAKLHVCCARGRTALNIGTR